MAAGLAWLLANPQKSWRGRGVPAAQRLPGVAGRVYVCTCLFGVRVGGGARVMGGAGA